MTQDSSILIIAQPGYLRDSLQVLLAALSEGRPVIMSSGRLGESINTVNSHPILVMVVLEPDIPGTEVSAAVAQVKTRWPETRLIVLVDSEYQAVTSYGADRVWFKGMLAAQMLVELEKLLNGRE